MLIGENQINEIFNEWLEDNGFDARIAGLEPDFGWYMSSDTIAYSFVVAEKFDKAFQRVCEDLGLNYTPTSVVTTEQVDKNFSAIKSSSTREERMDNLSNFCLARISRKIATKVLARKINTNRY